VTNIVDADDDVVKSYTYDAYGNTSDSGAFVNSFAYTGAVIDEETGLYYMNARYYEPETGRFISQDTYRGDGEAFWNLYMYCSGDPVNSTDPTGHMAELAAAAGACLSIGPVGWIILVAVAVVATVAIVAYSEHVKGARGSTKDQHTKPRPGRPGTKNRQKNRKSRSGKRR